MSDRSGQITAMRCFAAATTIAGILSAGDPVWAEDSADPFSFVDEVRLGVAAHDLATDGQRRENGADIGAELLFTPLPVDVDNSVLRILLTPRPHLGAALNTQGNTSAAYAGLTWHVPVTEHLFLEAAFGGAIHNGETNDVDPGMEPLGCRVLFREAATVGANISEHVRVMATISHLSNAGLCNENSGITDVGLSLGYRF